MKFISKIAMLAIFGILFSGLNVLGQGVTLPQASPKSELKQTVGISTIEIIYSRPNVVSPQGQDRTGNIWGGIVPYGFNNLGFGTATASPWRAGANENTIITFSHDVKVEGEKLKAGTYGLHMAVEEDKSATIIFSNKSTAWGSYFYDESDDALRVKVTTNEIAPTNLLTYHFTDIDSKSAVMALDWEKKRIPIKFEFDTPEIVYANLKNELESNPGFTLNSWTAAANYLASNNIHLEEALNWANNAVSGQFYSEKNFTTLSTKATVLQTMGKVEEANEVMEEALALPSAVVGNYYNYGRALLAQDNDSRALRIFKEAHERWPNDWLAHHGLARGYSATGDYKNALKHEEQAYANAPETSKQFLEGYMQSLKEGKDFN